MRGCQQEGLERGYLQRGSKEKYLEVTELLCIVLHGAQGLSGGTVVKKQPANAGDTRDMGSIPGWRRSPRVGNGNPFQYACLEDSMNRGAWPFTVHGVKKELGTTE